MTQEKVLLKKSDMLFSSQHVPTKLEYNGHSLNKIFSKRKKMFKPAFLKMSWQINKFNTESIIAKLHLTCEI